MWILLCCQHLWTLKLYISLCTISLSQTSILQLLDFLTLIFFSYSMFWSADFYTDIFYYNVLLMARWFPARLLFFHSFRFVVWFLSSWKLDISFFGFAFLKRNKLVLNSVRVSCLNFMLKWLDLVWTAYAVSCLCQIEAKCEPSLKNKNRYH